MQPIRKSPVQKAMGIGDKISYGREVVFKPRYKFAPFSSPAGHGEVYPSKGRKVLESRGRVPKEQARGATIAGT